MTHEIPSPVRLRNSESVSFIASDAAPSRFSPGFSFIRKKKYGERSSRTIYLLSEIDASKDQVAARFGLWNEPRPASILGSRMKCTELPLQIQTFRVFFLSILPATRKRCVFVHHHASFCQISIYYRAVVGKYPNFEKNQHLLLLLTNPCWNCHFELRFVLHDIFLLMSLFRRCHRFSCWRNYSIIWIIIRFTLETADMA